MPTLHRALSGVALTAALVLSVASLIRHHHAVELAVQLGVVALIAGRAAHLVRSTAGPEGGGDGGRAEDEP